MSFTVFSFDGKFPIVHSTQQIAPNFHPEGTGLHVIPGNPAPLPVGVLVNPDGTPAYTQYVPMDEARQLAKDEVMRLYEEQVYGVENKPTDLVIVEWREKELVAERWLSGQLPDGPLKDGYRIAMISSLTQLETAEFAAMGTPLTPGTDDDAICDILASRVVAAATAKRVLLHFAGGQRRDANDLIDAAPDYPTLAAGIAYIQQQVPLRTAAFMAQFQ